ncbi:transposase family protein, partial [Pseudoxanthomonas sp. J35]|uniref:transposase family protein n=1 Tax=Pseudoxanthomonas sp. J35 TaxID=935852 RepID=UPI0018DDF3E2
MSRWHREPRGGQRWLVIELDPQEGVRRCCSGCGQPVAAIHDRAVRRIRDLPVFEESVELRVQRLRL